ncbi:ATP-binding protein [Streptomyces sp. NBC_01619]|uniref:ATP-binding protein n=1 Tax=Streptomyces sp. NBC_01619 TaxID=2975901 RepID=UPI002255C222|nr:ATP-binding protein [Streptomyces sp. NBC_01619]MCX4515119.1 ATP-binding protein [Streptomyces sp. NBC_01619]
MPWLARHLALWSRTVAPLRPLSASAACAQARNASWPVARDLGSVGHARRKVTTRLSEWGMSDLADTVELLVSELVTNALRHTHGPVRLNLCLRGLHLRCEVEDADSAGPVRRIATPDAEGGRGMELVDVLAENWGSSGTDAGKVMWFELSIPDTARTDAHAAHRAAHPVR